MIGRKCLALVCIATAITGADAKDKDCHTITNPKERLACFDKGAAASTSKSLSLGQQQDQEFRNVIVSYLRETLADPDSIKDLEIGKAQAGITRGTDLSPAGISGYAVPVSFNAKNKFGGYVGLQRQVAFVSGGRVLFMFEAIILNLDWGPVQLGR